ncbi:hypothetical protein M0R45_006837 [Rubus argutus]|uniref:Uncharacterized protein n=1 Tax=Rubus argutus TaxID=59490 RepID=A0AAW1YRP6_RUBAR
MFLHYFPSSFCDWNHRKEEELFINSNFVNNEPTSVLHMRRIKPTHFGIDYLLVFQWRRRRQHHHFASAEDIAGIMEADEKQNWALVVLLEIDAYESCM